MLRIQLRVSKSTSALRMAHKLGQQVAHSAARKSSQKRMPAMFSTPKLTPNAVAAMVTPIRPQMLYLMARYTNGSAGPLSASSALYTVLSHSS